MQSRFPMILFIENLFHLAVIQPDAAAKGANGFLAVFGGIEVRLALILAFSGFAAAQFIAGEGRNQGRLRLNVPTLRMGRYARFRRL